MFNSVGALLGVERAPSQGRQGDSWALLQSYIAGMAATAGATLTAAAQEQPMPVVDPRPAAVAADSEKTERPDVRTLDEAQLLTHFGELMEKLGSNKYATREGAMHDLNEDVRRLLTRMN